MCRFDKYKAQIWDKIPLFQYISCVGSIKKILGFYNDYYAFDLQNIDDALTFFQPF